MECSICTRSQREKIKGGFSFPPPFLFLKKFFLREESIGFPWPCSVARAQLNPLHCTALQEKKFSVQSAVCSVQCWRGRGSEVLQAWEPEQTTLRKLFNTIMITTRWC